MFAIPCLLIAQWLAGCVLCAAANDALEGFTVAEIDDVLYTELRNDFGFPLTVNQSESLWNDAKEFQWDVMKSYDGSKRFPFVFCYHDPELQGNERIAKTIELLETAGTATNKPMTYYPKFVDKELRVGEQTAVEVLRNNDEFTCMFSSLYDSTPMHIAESNAATSDFLRFQPQTLSMSILSGTIDTVTTVTSGIVNRSLKLILVPCATVGGVAITPEMIMGETEKFMAKSSSSSDVSLATEECFFSSLIRNGAPHVSQRMRMWGDALKNGVDAPGNSGCADTMSRVVIQEISNGDFTFEVKKKDTDFKEYSDQDCVFSLIVALAEMPLICIMEHQGHYATSPDETTHKQPDTVSSSFLLSPKVVQHTMLLVGTMLLSLLVTW
mmetsp:Transcript_45679/g.67418  ORF Transcript_45679/g.67418 Transcript_45679/m.67418 type:complete len:383 (+) Transcript_45679:142-1290(+)|eukprot:CAMPEP_0195511076 /NCGR_PEP_ID=MMETSP0794_2-20130614/3527_1 /TAXON_ID=515487 /ORGANISM="Stephanopyxis turris, Strain CCMP 815" /LENGTH=382 /DNA_ID=CAMNT_0040638619 /DNA_START=127 /DNA_END=1272 /DNA_ORIENTATION=+